MHNDCLAVSMRYAREQVTNDAVNLLGILILRFWQRLWLSIRDSRSRLGQMRQGCLGFLDDGFSDMMPCPVDMVRELVWVFDGRCLLMVSPGQHQRESRGSNMPTR